jgi:F0F1-type ATP synthase membrane subunit b/b'
MEERVMDVVDGRRRAQQLLASLMAQVAAARGDADGVTEAAEQHRPQKRRGPINRTREEARRRRQRARLGLPVVEPASIGAAIDPEADR